MSCCLDFSEAKSIISEIVEKYHPTDYKIFTAKRVPLGIDAIYHIGLVVGVDEINDAMFKEFLSLKSNSDTKCIEILQSEIDLRDSRVIDLFMFRVKVEYGRV